MRDDGEASKQRPEDQEEVRHVVQTFQDGICHDLKSWICTESLEELQDDRDGKAGR